mmetsp:Transcript_40128/g.97410  ORF Transcript_40128/g.97410 Transcript_40128/m.97410 type:complete len:88 (+) Transcript_40128:1094-1357(+)
MYESRVDFHGHAQRKSHIRDQCDRDSYFSMESSYCEAVMRTPPPFFVHLLLTERRQNAMYRIINLLFDTFRRASIKFFNRQIGICIS